MTGKAPRAVFVTHRCKSGQRDDAVAIWMGHMKAAIAANPGHLDYFYAVDVLESDVIRAFQLYRSGEDAAAYLKHPDYLAYVEAVAPYLSGPPKVGQGDLVWAKNGSTTDGSVRKTGHSTSDIAQDIGDSGPSAARETIRSLRRFYEAEANYSAAGSPRDRAALLETLHPDIILRQPQSLPYGGTWRGREGFSQWLDAFVEAWSDVTPTDPQLFSCGNDVIVSSVTMQARARQSGNTISMPMCQIIKFADGLPVDWTNFAWDTVAMLDALSAQGAGRQ